MKAVILAAGQGTRLGEDVPKCLIKIRGRTILERQVELLKSIGVGDIIAVIGKRGVWTQSYHDYVKAINEVDVVVNPRSMETQSPYSLLLGMGDTEDTLIVIDGDLVFERNTLEVISSSENKSIVLVKWNETGSGSKVIIKEDKKKAYYLSSIGEELISDYVYAGVIRVERKHIKLLKETLETRKYDNEVLAKPISAMSKRVRIECIKLVGSRDGEELLELAMMAGGSFSKTSKLIRGKPDNLIIRKEVIPPGESKLIDEIEWITGLPDPVKKHFPEVMRYNINREPTYFEMPCYNLPTLRTLLLEGVIGAHEALDYLKHIFDFMFTEVYKERRPTGRNFVREMHLRRIYSRLIEVKNTVYLFREFVDADSIRINGREYENIIPIVNKINQNWEMMKFVTPPYTCRTHGDLHFDNILIDTQRDDFILVDPRGNFDYDVFYDLGKIWHSCHGLYDFIHTGKFSMEQKGLDIKYRFENGGVLKEYDEILVNLSEVLSEYEEISSDDDWLIKTLFSEASHFASVAPFHLKMDGKEEVAILCYVKGVELINEIYTTLLDTISRKQIIEGDVININTADDYRRAQERFD